MIFTGTLHPGNQDTDFSFESKELWLVSRRVDEPGSEPRSLAVNFPQPSAIPSSRLKRGHCPARSVVDRVWARGRGDMRVGGELPLRPSFQDGKRGNGSWTP